MFQQLDTVDHKAADQIFSIFGRRLLSNSTSAGLPGAEEPRKDVDLEGRKVALGQAGDGRVLAIVIEHLG